MSGAHDIKKLLLWNGVMLLVISLSCHPLLAQDKGASEKKEVDRGAQAHGSATDPAESGQPKSSFDKQSVIVEAKAQLASMSSTLMQELIEFCSKNSITGEFVADITLEGKGNVLTVFMVSATEDDIPKKNLLKNKLSELKFENIKIPKRERVKFRYTLKF